MPLRNLRREAENILLVRAPSPSPDRSLRPKSHRGNPRKWVCNPRGEMTVMEKERNGGQATLRWSLYLKRCSPQLGLGIL